MVKGYILLAVAIALEIVSTSMLKASCGFTKLMPSVAFIAGMGTALTALVAVVIWHEQMDFTTGLGIVFIIVGVILLNIRSITN